MAKAILTTQRTVTLPEIRRAGVVEQLVIHELPDNLVRFMIGDEELFTCTRAEMGEALALLK
jgi:hypothetical protein